MFNTDTVVPVTANAIIAFQEFNEASKPRENERLVKICYRVDNKTGVKLRESVCLSVPYISPEAIKSNIDKFLPLFLASIQEQQDKIARKLYETGSKSISTTQLNLDAVAEFLEESVYESRLTKELIDTWFDNTVTYRLAMALRTKQPDMLQEKVTAITTEYKNKFSALAGGRTTYEIPVATALLKVFDLITDSDDTLTIRLFTRLSDMLTKTKKVEENLFSLL